MYRIIFSLLAVGTLTVASGTGSSNIDPAHRFSWGENIGFINWQHDAPLTGDGVFVEVDHLSGFAWAENVGWANPTRWRTCRRSRQTASRLSSATWASGR